MRELMLVILVFLEKHFFLRNLKEFGFGKKSMEGVILIEAEELVATLMNLTGKPISTHSLFNPVEISLIPFQARNSWYYIIVQQNIWLLFQAVVNSFWQICVGERFSHDDPELAQMVQSVVQ